MQISVLMQSFLMVFLAEMGDKSQFLMLALSERYRKHDILLGSALAILLLNLLAVLLGSAMGEYLPQDGISVIAGMAFLAFALMDLLESEKEEKTHHVRGKWAIGTVFGTYFLAELGDKTQLTALALAAGGEASWGHTVSVLVGSSLGLFLCGGIAVFLGDLLGKRLPERLFARISVLLFFVCGVVRLLEGFGGLFHESAHPVLFSVFPTLAMTFICLIIVFKERNRNVRNYTSRAQSISKQRQQ